MSSKAKDMAGQRFGMLIALRRDGTSPNGCAKWECRCDCGSTVYVDSTRLRKGRARHCGCQYARRPATTITWNRETRTISGWANVMQLPAKLICNRLAAGWPTDKLFGGGRKQQPCWGCKRACGGCSWSRNFTPVPGWDAVETTINLGCGRESETYQIISCPEFEPDEPR